MTHLLLLVKKQTLTLGECQHGSYSPFLYKGNEEEYWPDKDSLFWEGFWKYVFKEKRLGPDDQIALSIIFHADEADIPKIKKIIAWPWQERIASLRMQPIWQILPELVCKEGLLKENSPLYVAWNGATWQINAQGAEPTTSQFHPIHLKINILQIALQHRGLYSQTRSPPQKQVEIPTQRLPAMWLPPKLKAIKAATCQNHTICKK